MKIYFSLFSEQLGIVPLACNPSDLEGRNLDIGTLKASTGNSVYVPLIKINEKLRMMLGGRIL